MSNSIHRLLPMFDRAVARAQSLVLGTVVHTSGPTYTKAGAQMLIAADGETAGLLSGGCLEGDLAENAREVFANGAAKSLHYAMRGPNDLVFGSGSGCEGDMDVLLQRLDAGVDWQPMARLVDAWRHQRSETALLVVRSSDATLPAGSGVFLSNGAMFGLPHPARRTGTDDTVDAQPVVALRELAATMQAPLTSLLMRSAVPNVDLLVLHQPAPVHVLVLGAGPDARPVAQYAHALGWRVTIVDHRSHYAQSVHFPGAAALFDGGPASLVNVLANASSLARPILAAVVMSHFLEHDRAYLQELARTDIPYIGLLGPGSRRDRLLGELGDCATRLRGRLRAPIGLDLGGTSPEAIALSIVAEIQAMLAGRSRVGPISAL